MNSQLQTNNDEKQSSSDVETTLHQGVAADDDDDGNGEHALQMCHRRCCRCCIAVTGILIASLFYIPNIFASDKSATAADLGMPACLLFLVGGIIGGMMNAWKGLLPGLICQILSFLVFSF